MNGRHSPISLQPLKDLFLLNEMGYLTVSGLADCMYFTGIESDQATGAESDPAMKIYLFSCLWSMPVFIT